MLRLFRAVGTLQARSCLLRVETQARRFTSSDILDKHFEALGEASEKGRFGKAGSEQPLGSEHEASMSHLRLTADGALCMTWVRDMMDVLSRRAELSGKARAKEVPVPKPIVMQLLSMSLDQFVRIPSLTHLDVPPKASLNVCGDTHGQFFDLKHIFSSSVASWPSKKNIFLFNGDFVDRGVYSLEVIITLLGLKLAEPTAMHLLRGNHETTDMNSMYGFEKQVLATYDWEVLEGFRRVFDSLPLAAVIGDAALVVHGGLGPLTSRMTLAQLGCLDRFSFDSAFAGGDAGGVVPPAVAAAAAVNDEAVRELLWADPIAQTAENPLVSAEQQRGFVPNTARGGGQQFGPDVTNDFLSSNKLGLLLRSHECRTHGFSVDHDLTSLEDRENENERPALAPKRCITVFSAPNYCDAQGNLGAFVRFNRVSDHCGLEGLDPSSVQVLYGGRMPGRDIEYRVVQFAAVPHPHSSPNALKILAQQHQRWARRHRSAS